MDHLVKLIRIYGTKPPMEGQGVRLGLYQGQGMVGSMAAVDFNLNLLLKAVKEASEWSVQLLAFPELYISGYSMKPDVMKGVAMNLSHPVMRTIQDIAQQYKMSLLVPYPEISKGEYFDSMVLFGSEGEVLCNYRKTHLFGAAERASFSFGHEYCVPHVNGFPVGLLNCYEAEFPELSRILALRGAKLIIMPTAADYFYKMHGSWTAVPYPDATIQALPARAYENSIFVAYSNRVGYEQVGNDRFYYRGNSGIWGPNANHVVTANNDEQTLLIADCIPSFAKPSHPEGNYLRDRRPELYSELVAPHSEEL
eukprot:gnl/Trimastix_PCT/2672.p1 GENE.gnl/Trimastix_PCT/2672~~gnl/Trimastix_PCT/2672.p1  ORF type:complete len:352 (+),score=82.09 gnl/Trimastix_PCT/2672:128-1057(+)